MASWFKALARTRDHLTDSLRRVFAKSGAEDEVSLEELEETLLGADVPARLVSELIDELESNSKRPGTDRRRVLREQLLESLSSSTTFEWNERGGTQSILLVGINGSGKTTSAAKLGYQVLQLGSKVILGAADTFRAAGSEQLRVWADKLGLDVVTGATGADAAAVAYDTLDAAIARNADVVIIDTAGRMHTKEPLMNELGKITRAMSKRIDGAPDEIWAVLDASLGQNAVIQAKTFNEAVPLTGIVVTKLDGSSKAGFLFAVSRQLGVPIRYVGLGEQAEDLAPFDAAAFVDALLGLDAEEVAAGS